MKKSETGGLRYTNGRIVKSGDFALLSDRGYDANSSYKFVYGHKPIYIKEVEYDSTGKKVKGIYISFEDGYPCYCRTNEFKAKGTETLHYFEHTQNNIQDYVQSYLKYLHELVAQDDMDAALALAKYYARTRRKFNNDEECLAMRQKAKQYFELASQSGHAIASYCLAIKYVELVSELEKNHVYLDSNKHLYQYYLMKSAEQGFSLSQHNVAFNYDYGRENFPQDYDKAVYWYNQAAKQSHARSINNLANKYEHGLGVDQNYQQAMDYYLQAAKQKIPEAIFSIGNMYLAGKGVDVSVIEAKAWFEKASRLHYKPALESLQAIEHNKYNT